ncbi:MAG: hypothetical protein GF353_19410 [Candidatus Lokiarchaeota archaeon]|nr:hypothetical protein [Candidatus Lokiarchaeota archaeon]
MKIGNIDIETTKIICVGENYLDHIEEVKKDIPKEPILFPKTLNVLIGHEQPIVYPKYLFNNRRYKRVDYEAELAFFIKKKCKNVQKSEAYDYIMGYTAFNDVTARKMQVKDMLSQKPWYRSKSFDTFGPIGPRIALSSEIEDPHNLDIKLYLNGELKQSSNTKHLLFKIPELVDFISKFFTLEAGDIIATGTPGGIGPVKPNDEIKITINKIGTLFNKVVLEE